MNKDNKKEGTQLEAKCSTCGIVMPISAIENCSENHWREVKGIITDSIESAGFDARLVSEANDSGIIQKRIVQNLYSNDIVICDVSCKNPNVMFELGMRLAFDKPTIIVMDNMTKYSFDTAPIEHLVYPRDLNYYQIIEFKKNLGDKIKGTIEAAKKPDYTTFLKHFGEFKLALIENKKGTIDEVVISKLEEMSRQLSEIRVRAWNKTPERIEFESETKRIDNHARKLIDEFCRENKILEEDLYKTNEEDIIRRMLFSYMENDSDMRNLCRNPRRIRKAISDNLCPF